MTSDRYVPTRAIREAVKGRELEVLKAVGIAWDGGSRPINCPYPDHSDANPSWRWNEARQRAHCTCDQRSHSIFDVVMRIEGLEFQGAKLRVAEILGRQDLIKVRDGQRYQAMDAASLLHPPVHQRDDQLPRAYLGFRLDVPAVDVLMPSTPVAGGERSRIRPACEERQQPEARRRSPLRGLRHDLTAGAPPRAPDLYGVGRSRKG